jgi:hypothetical protein
MRRIILILVIAGAVGVGIATQVSAKPTVTPLTPAEKAAIMAKMPPVDHCTITFTTVIAGPGTDIKKCIDDDPNIPHGLSHFYPGLTKGVAPTYADGKPTMLCPSWGPQGGVAAVAEGTKVCPLPPGFAPLSPAEQKAAFQAP